MSLTAHWVTEEFERKHGVLNAHAFDGSHTGELIRLKFYEMFKQWKSELDWIHLVVRNCDELYIRSVIGIGSYRSQCISYQNIG